MSYRCRNKAGFFKTMLFCTLGREAFLQKKKTETHDQSGAVDAAHPSAR